jgi:RNA-directed DNA polymerase
MMNDPEKSDPCTVAVKSANKPELGAESMERKRGTEGNADKPVTRRTQSRISVSPGLDRVRERAKAKKKERFTSLLPHVDVDLLRGAYHCLKRDAAPGVDKRTWVQYGEQLEANLVDLHGRLHRGAYQALPSRRVFIDKEDGRKRPLGVASLEDKILQRAIVEVLNAIYETDFLGFSYGFRPGRGQHDALDALATGITRGKVSWILDADISSFFDKVDHGWLDKFLKHRIGDKRVLRLIGKWLKAGVLEDGELKPTDEGTPQGAVASPLLANVYLHYVFDLWANQWRERHARGDMILVRYADDTVVGFQHESTAKRFLVDLRKRLEAFALTLHPAKTRLIQFGRFAADRRRERGLGKPETFNFLGFTHICSRTRSGRFQLMRKTRRDRLNGKLREIKEVMRRRMHRSLEDQGKWLRQVGVGYFGYHAVPTNTPRLVAFRYHVMDIWRRSLKRRSQKDKTTWARIDRLAERWLPPVKVLHPWPEARFTVKHPRWEPSARVAPARICAGGAQ